MALIDMECKSMIQDESLEEVIKAVKEFIAQVEYKIKSQIYANKQKKEKEHGSTACSDFDYGGA